MFILLVQNSTILTVTIIIAIILILLLIIMSILITMMITKMQHSEGSEKYIWSCQCKRKMSFWSKCEKKEKYRVNECLKSTRRSFCWWEKLQKFSYIQASFREFYEFCVCAKNIPGLERTGVRLQEIVGSGKSFQKECGL